MCVQHNGAGHFGHSWVACADASPSVASLLAPLRPLTMAPCTAQRANGSGPLATPAMLALFQHEVTSAPPAALHAVLTSAAPWLVHQTPLTGAASSHAVPATARSAWVFLLERVGTEQALRAALDLYVHIAGAPGGHSASLPRRATIGARNGACAGASTRRAQSPASPSIEDVEAATRLIMRLESELSEGRSEVRAGECHRAGARLDVLWRHLLTRCNPAARVLVALWRGHIGTLGPDGAAPVLDANATLGLAVATNGTALKSDAANPEALRIMLRDVADAVTACANVALDTAAWAGIERCATCARAHM
jgi:hypothetical protein